MFAETIAEKEVEIVRLMAEIERLRALLRRHDDAAAKDERMGIDMMWVPEFRVLVEDTRSVLEQLPTEGKDG